MKIAIVTAGGAGMFCGSCMHDNTWARGLLQAGHDVTLIPTYTPVRLDEENISSHKVFLGGINIYLESRSKLWRSLPRFLTRWLDSPKILQLASKLSISNDARDLGELTIASLQGADGPQKREVRELAEFVCDQLQPDVLCFSNILQVGTVRTIRERFRGKIFCVLQGDDIFLNDLPEAHRTQSLTMIGERADDFDGFIVHSAYYRDYMAKLLSLPLEKFHILPLGIDLTGHDGVPYERDSDVTTIGFFARVCPEKGFDQTIEAFRLLHSEHPNSRLILGGYLGARDRPFFDRTMSAASDLSESVQYLGSPGGHAEKVAFYKQCDLFSVPTRYHEPKGLPVLEAWANGVPVVQPSHGAFPEMIERTGGGLLVRPDDPEGLAAGWSKLIADADLRQAHAVAGHLGVREHFSVERMIAESVRLFEEVKS